MNCHNGEKYLTESIKSIFSQSYKNWELIFYDNKSTDKSIDIVNQFKDKRIKIYKNKKKLKLYKARNQAISLAKGEFITFLDTDDIWHAEKLKTQINFLSKKKSNVAFTKYCFLKNNKIFSFKNKFNITNPNTQNLIDNYNLGILTAMVHKSIFKTNSFEEKYEIIGDFDFFINLSLKENFCFIDEHLAYYRLHRDNLSQIKIKVYISEMENWIKKKKIFFYKKNIKLAKLNKYLFKLKIKKFLFKFNFFKILNDLRNFFILKYEYYL